MWHNNPVLRETFTQHLVILAPCMAAKLWPDSTLHVYLTQKLLRLIATVVFIATVEAERRFLSY